MICPASPRNIARAARVLRQGELVAFPTETVYGLGADATSDTAVARIFEVKNRPTFNPLIIHVTDFEAAARLAEFPETAMILARQFWPGPLSLVARRRPDCQVSLLASAGLDTLAIRVPDHKTARTLLAQAEVPVAAPSANASGRLSPTRAQHVAQSLGGTIGLILDDGPCPVGIESTVVDAATEPPTILRPGGITAEEIRSLVGPIRTMETSDAPASPGMLVSHYAPERPLRLNAMSVRSGEALLSFGRHYVTGAAAEQNLSRRGSLQEAASNLFAQLRAIDRPEFSGIAVMPIPERGLGRAINDRLRRAAASSSE